MATGHTVMVMVEKEEERRRQPSAVHDRGTSGVLPKNVTKIIFLKCRDSV